MASETAPEKAEPRLPDALAKVQLARHQLKEVRSWIDELEGRLARKTQRWLDEVRDAAEAGVGPSEVLLSADWLELETAADRETAEKAWDFIHGFGNSCARARMHLLATLDSMRVHREHVDYVRAAAWLRIRKELGSVGLNSLPEEFREAFMAFSSEPSVLAEAEAAKIASPDVFASVERLPKEQLARLLGHPKLRPGELATWCAREAQAMFSLEYPELGHGVSVEDWAAVLRVWSRGQGEDKGTESEEKWQYLADFVARVGLEPIAPENLKKAWSRWRKGK